MEINEVLDQAKHRSNIESDYALAKVLGIDRSIVSSWRKGKKHPNNEDAVKIATLAGLDEMKVIATIEYQNANTENKKEFWKSYMESRGITACLNMTTLAAAIILTPEPAAASILQLQNYDAQNANFLTSNLYIMRHLDA